MFCGCAAEKAGTSKSGDPAPPAVVVTEAKVGAISQTLAVSGAVSPVPGMEADVSPTVSGQLESIPVRMGDPVVKGQVMARLARNTLTGQMAQAQATVSQDEVQVAQARVSALQQKAAGEAGIEQARSAVENARATLAGCVATLAGDRASLSVAQRQYVREQSLLKDGLVAQKDVDSALLAVQTAQSNVDAQQQAVSAQEHTIAGLIDALHAAETARLQDVVKQQDIAIAEQQLANARGALSAMGAQLGLYTLTSPLTGIVTAIGANPGETVDPSTKVVHVENLDRMELTIGVPADATSLVRPGQPVTFTADGLPGRTFSTTVRTVSSQVDTTSGSLQAYCFVENRGRVLHDDQTTIGEVTVARHSPAVLIPAAAVLTDPASGAKSAAVVDTDGLVHVRPASTGIESGGWVEVNNGIRAGDLVVVSGQYGLADGTKVSVRRAP